MAVSTHAFSSDWGLTSRQSQWPVGVYPLTAVSPIHLSFGLASSDSEQGCLLVFFGRVADVYGKNKTFITGTIVVTIFTLAASFAQGEHVSLRKRLSAHHMATSQG